MSSKNRKYGTREPFEQLTVIHVGQNDDRLIVPKGISEDFVENVVRTWTLLRERTLNGKNETIPLRKNTETGVNGKVGKEQVSWSSCVRELAGKYSELRGWKASRGLING